MNSAPLVITCTLRKILDNRKIGIREFSRDLGISHVNLLGICSAKWMPRLDLALRIARKLDVRIEAIWRVG